MKGIIILSNADLERCPEAEDNLIPFCEFVEQNGDNSLFHSKEGTLMTMICVLLDKEIKYTLDFKNQEISSGRKKRLKASKQPNKITQN